MTKYMYKDVVCINCRHESRHTVLASTSSIGSNDLDLRPPPMRRFTMRNWVQCCPACGYCASDIAESEGDLSKVSSDENIALLKDMFFPELARKFLSYAFLILTSNTLNAASQRLHAAWVCDDEKLEEQAIKCRLLSAECISALKPFKDDQDSLTKGIVLVDILRRAKEFDRALVECQSLSEYKSLPKPMRQVLDFELQLIAKQDVAAHRVSECVSSDK